MVVRDFFISAVILAVAATFAWADIVHLNNGGRLEGVVDTSGDNVTVTNKYGSTTVHVSAVKSVEKTATVLDEYDKKAAIAASTDLRAQRIIADFCRENGLTSKERYHLLLILRLRPDDIEARSRLGYVKKRREWITKAEEMYDRGLTRFRGKWVSPAAKKAIMEEESRRKVELAAKRREEREKKAAALREKRLAQARREKRQRESTSYLGLTNVSDRYYYPRDYYGYGYSITSPYGRYYRFPRRLPENWVWYRRWTGVGLSVDYRSGDWRIRWGR